MGFSLRDLTRFIPGVGQAVDIATTGYGLLKGIQGERRANKADKRAGALQNQALQFQQQQYAERAPMRQLGNQMMLDQQPEDLSALFRTSNPMAARGAVRALGQPQPDPTAAPVDLSGVVRPRPAAMRRLSAPR